MSHDGDKIPPKYAAEVERFYDANCRWGYAYACLLVGGGRSSSDSGFAPEDLVQEAFVAATLAWDTLRGLADIQQRSWLRTTVQRKASSIRRRSQKFRDLLPDICSDEGGEQLAADEAAVSAVMAEGVLVKVEEVIGDLPPKQKKIAVLRWIHRLPYAIIAAELETTPNAVAVQVHTIRRKLIDALGEDYPFGRDAKEGSNGNS